MNFKLIHALAAGIVLLFAINASAGDFASLSVIGFSKDGRYLAYEEYGLQDASGYPYSNIHFIDTSKNAYAAPRVRVVIEDESGAEITARKRSAALAAKKLKQLAIVRGNTGRLIVSHLMTDQTYDDGTRSKTVDRVKFYEEVWSMHREGDYELVLTPIKIKMKNCSVYEEDPVMIELKLTDHVADTSKFLQKDMTIPDSRGCPQYYRIQDVYLYKGLIAVFIGVFTQGFEGPDMRFMTVVGNLK